MGRKIVYSIAGVLLLVMVICNSAIAQSAPETQDASIKHFGLRAGLLLSTVSIDSGYWDQDPGIKPGIDLAISASIPLGKGGLGLQPELHWLQKGYQISDATADTFLFGKVINTFNYIDLPVLLRYSFGASKNLFVIGGPCAGYFISGTQNSDTYGTQSFDKSTFHRLEWSMYLGAGMVLGALEVDLRYMQGFNDIAEGTADVINRSFSAGLRYAF